MTIDVAVVAMVTVNGEISAIASAVGATIAIMVMTGTAIVEMPSDMEMIAGAIEKTAAMDEAVGATKETRARMIEEIAPVGAAVEV